MEVLVVENLNVNGKTYEIIRLLGHGKGGYSYLVTDGECQYVLKQIHHEPCSYYQFGNKIESESRDYEKLNRIGILMPQMYEVDIENERILKGRSIFVLFRVNYREIRTKKIQINIYKNEMSEENFLE